MMENRRPNALVPGEPLHNQTLATRSMLDNQTILLAEDDPNDVLLIERAFHKAGLRNSLKTVSDGSKAIEYLSGRGVYADRERFPQPFLLLLDLKMPRTDGFEVLKWVRAEPELNRLLVVVLTSSTLQRDVDRAYELGANSYLVKPVELAEMAHMIQRFEVYWSEINRRPSPVSSATVAQSETSVG